MCATGTSNIHEILINETISVTWHWQNRRVTCVVWYNTEKRVLLLTIQPTESCSCVTALENSKSKVLLT